MMMNCSDAAFSLRDWRTGSSSGRLLSAMARPDALRMPSGGARPALSQTGGDLTWGGRHSVRDMEKTSVTFPHARHRSVPRVTTTLSAIRVRYDVMSSTDSPDFCDIHGAHKGRSMISVAMSAALAGILLSPSHRSQFNDASAPITLVPVPDKAGFCTYRHRGRPGICEAHVEVMCQAAVAIRERMLANQKLSEFHHGVSPKANLPTQLPTHRNAPLPVRIAGPREPRCRSFLDSCAFTEVVFGSPDGHERGTRTQEGTIRADTPRTHEPLPITPNKVQRGAGHCS